MLPTSELWLPFVRTFGTSGSTLLGLAQTALSITQAALGGFYTAPWNVPDTYDRTREGEGYVYIGTSGLGGAAGNVVLQCVKTISPFQSPPVDVTFSQVVAIPAAWPAGSWLEVLLRNGTAEVLPAGSIPSRGNVGIRVARDGPNVLDTWASSLLILQFVKLRYHAECRQCCPG
jgi:hypothetical protein